jgi:hypothetical protein
MIYMSVEFFFKSFYFHKLSFGFDKKLLNLNTQNQIYKTLG